MSTRRNLGRFFSGNTSAWQPGKASEDSPVHEGQPDLPPLPPCQHHQDLVWKVESKSAAGWKILLYATVLTWGSGSGFLTPRDNFIVKRRYTNKTELNWIYYLLQSGSSEQWQFLLHHCSLSFLSYPSLSLVSQGNHGQEVGPESLESN